MLTNRQTNKPSSQTDRMLYLYLFPATRVDMMRADEQDPFSRSTLISAQDTANTTTITSVMPADFNGDAYMDLLVTRRDKSGNEDAPLQVQIYYGQKTNPGIG